jgi:hypothetical protein
VKAVLNFCLLPVVSMPLSPHTNQLIPRKSEAEAAAYAALQKACDEAEGFRSLIGSPRLQQAVDTDLKTGVALSEVSSLVWLFTELAQ